MRIDPAACSSCGRCAAACPTGAITAAPPPPARVYECGRVRGAANGAATVTCLGGFSAGDLRDALGGGDVTLVDRGWCAGCPVSGGDAAPWARAVETVNAEAAALDIAQRVHVRHAPRGAWRARPAPAGRAADASKRAVFTRLARGRAGDTGPRDPLDALPGPVDTPGPRRRLAQLAALAGDAPLPGALFPALSVVHEAPDLGALARLCPTGALTLAAAGDREELRFDPTACIACGECTATGALALHPVGEGTLACAQVLATRRVATCHRCRMRFAPTAGQSVCNACARDTDLAALAHGLTRHV